MISAATFHVITTELAVGMFALAGVAFLLCLLEKGPEARVAVAHWAMFGGMLATPLAIFSGVQASPGEGLDNPMLANKLLLSMAALGLSIGVLTRFWLGATVDRLHSGLGMIATGLILTTAGIGGEYSRGETLLFFIPKDVAVVLPTWASIVLIVLAMVIMGKSAIEHRS